MPVPFLGLVLSSIGLTLTKSSSVEDGSPSTAK
jgi:hypothetical protein